MLLTIVKKSLPPDITVLDLTGRIVLGRYCKDLEWAVDEILKEKHQKKVIFDMSKVERIDSTGIGVLVMCSSNLRNAGGELRLAGASGTVDEVLRKTRIDALIQLDPTLDSAASAFRGTATA